jgi:hypothetical protein
MEELIPVIGEALLSSAAVSSALARTGYVLGEASSCVGKSLPAASQWVEAHLAPPNDQADVGGLHLAAFSYTCRRRAACGDAGPRSLNHNNGECLKRVESLERKGRGHPGRSGSLLPPAVGSSR